MSTCKKCGGDLSDETYLCPRCGESTGKTPKARRWRIVSLIVVTAILLFCTALGVFLQHETHRGKQKRAMGEVRSIATACQAYATDTNGFPIQEKLGPATGIRKEITPDYTHEISDPDLWGAPYLYMSRGNVEAAVTPPGRVATDFLVICTGKDRKLDPETEELLKPGPDGEAKIWTAKPTKRRGFDSDIIWLNDSFLQNPGG